MISNSPFYNVVVFSLFWGLHIFVAKLEFLAGAMVLPFQIQSALIALLVLLLFLQRRVFQELKVLFSEQRALFWRVILANAIHYGVGGCLGFIGISLTTAVNAGFLVKLTLVSTTILAWRILGESFSLTKALTVMTMLLGAYLLSTKGSMIIPNMGDLLIVCACFAWSFGNVLLRGQLKDYEVTADLVSFLKPIAGIPILLLPVIFCRVFPAYSTYLKPVVGERIFEFGPFSVYILAAGVCAALVWVYLNRTLKVVSASYMTMITSVFVAVLAMVFLNERMELVQVLGALLIVASGFVVYFSDIAEDGV